MQQLTGTDESGLQWLATIFDDGTGEIATRRPGDTWSAPVILTAVPDETPTRLTEREYIRHEVEALFAAQDRGDDSDVRSTAATLQQILHIIGLGAGDVGETCSRIYMEQGQYMLPDRERERAVQAVTS